jgi:polyketide synthase PksJ
MSQNKIDKRNVEEMTGLTAMQEGMLFHYLSNRDSKQYVEQFRFKLSGKIDKKWFKKAWHAVAQTNEMLRSVIRWEKLEEPVQIVLKNKEIPNRIIDLSGEEEEVLPVVLAKIAAEDTKDPIDLTREPLRVVLVLLEDNKGNKGNKDIHESEMIVTFHHILYDGWSNGIVLTEFLDAYNRLARDEEPVKIHKTRYREFFKWYQRCRAQDKDKQEEFWRRYLEGFDTRTVLPYDHNKRKDICRVQSHRVDIPPAFKARMDACSEAQHVTLSTILYASWGILLQKYNNSDDIIFGTTVSGRPPEVKGIDAMVGLFINTIPLRLKAAADHTVLQVLAETGTHLNERSRFEHTPLTAIKQLTGMGKEDNLFDSIMVIDNYPLDRVLNAAGSLTVCSYEMFEMTNFDLTLQIMLIDADHMRVDFHTNADLFEFETVKRLASHYLNILAGMTGDPAGKISEVPMLSGEEREQILSEFNSPAIEYIVSKTIHGEIADRVERSPDNRAVQYRDGWLTYRELNERSNRLAHMLGGMGVSVGSRVVMMFPRSIDMIIALLGILKSGAACIPLDIGHPEERNAFIIEDSEAGFFLKHKEITFKGRAQTGVTEIGYDAEELNAYPAANPGEAAQPTDLSYIIYTSGSTGNPKGALLHHSGIVNHTYSKIGVLGITEQDTVANNFSINVIAAVWQILSPLFMGARLVVYDEEIEWDPYRQFRQVWVDGVTVIEVIPPVLKAYLFMLEEGKKKIGLECLRKIALTSEETKPFVVNKFYTFYPSGIDLVDCYGMTECCDDVLHYTIPADTDTKRVPIGTPSLNTKVLVLNHHGQLQPVGVAGEICVIGAGVGYGYWKRPELTAEKFLEDFYRSNRTHRTYSSPKTYRTGDLGRWLPEGIVEYLGRLDHQVKVRGNRVELREIENHLLRCPAVKEAAVVVREDKEGENILYAFFIPAAEISAAEIREFLLQTLPDYMVPGQFVPMEKLPLTPNGKIDRKALVKMEIAQSIASGAEYKPPRSEFESKIREIWAELLDRDREQIGINDNFFDLGGHSLLLIKLKSKLEKTFNPDREIGIIELFNYPTIAHQAKLIGEVEVKVKDSTHPGLRPPFSRGETVDRDIAVIGISLRVPGARNIAEFWENLIEGTESISFFSQEELEVSEGYRVLGGHLKLIPAGGVMGDIDLFDADFFGYTPREAGLMDPQQRLFLEYSWQALEDAGYVGEAYPGEIGVYAGVGWNTYLLNHVLANPGIINAMGEFQTMIGNDKDFLATRVSYKLNLKGPALTVQTACSTSLAAVHLARQGLLNGDCDMALAGGVVARMPEKSGYFYTEGGHLSPDGHCRAFDAEAKGTVFSNGIGIVVLKRLAEAVMDRDHIYAVVKGSAINNDGSLKVGYTSPSEIGQANVIAHALTEGGIDPETIGYIETHGTGTVLGDPVEMAALTRAFREVSNNGKGSTGSGGKKQYCAVGSVKSNIGHLDTAAGVVGFIKAVLCLAHKQIPPSIHVTAPNPMIDFTDSPFYLNRTPRDWPENENGTPRRAATSSLGIGGTNAHVVLEEWPEDAGRRGGPPYPPPKPDKHRLILLSAKSQTVLDEMTVNLAEYFKKHPGISLADAAYTLQMGRARFPYRRMVVCAGVDEAIAALAAGEKIKTVYAPATYRPVIFMFPGQGSQYENMGLELYRTEPVFREEMDRCFALLKPLMGYDIKEILYRSDKSDLSDSPDINQTEIAQPVIFVIEYALARLLMNWGIKPYAMTGHSIGEYTAACLSGVFALEDALKLVAARGRLMQQMAPGAMLSVSAPVEEIIPLLKENDEISLAAVNASLLCVVSGSAGAVEVFAGELKTRGYECSRLHTSHAFHSPMMDPILKPFKENVEQVRFNQPGTPYISNLTGNWITGGEVKSPRYWVDHLRQTVRFADGLEKLLEIEAPVFIEIGPGNVLSTFVRRHSSARSPNREEQTVVDLVRHPKNQVPDSYYLLNGIGQLWLHGVEIDRGKFYAGEERHRIPLPPYPFERKSYLLQSGQEGSRGRLAAVPGQEAVRNKEEIEDWFYIPTWKQSIPSFVNRIKRENSVSRENCRLLFLDEAVSGTGVQGRFLRLFEESRQDIITVRIGEKFAKADEGVYIINPGHEDDYVLLLEDLRQGGKTIAAIVHLWMLVPGVPADYLERGVLSLLYLVKTLGRLSMFDNIDLRVVSNRMHGIEKGDICSPEKAMILGCCKVISQEYPNIICRCLDMDMDTDTGEQAIAEKLFFEVNAASMDRIVAFRGSNRWVQDFEPVKLEKDPGVPIILREKGVYLVIGGLGNIGLSFARYLAQSVQARLILTELPGSPGRDEDSDKASNIKSLEQMGAEVLVIQADLGDKEQMSAVFREVETRFGTLHGVIHCAGVMAERYFKLISELDRETCEVHFGSKIRGLYVLEELTGDRALDFCILTSSLSSILGGITLYAYSAANSFMDAFAQRQAHVSGKNWLSIDWDEWKIGHTAAGPGPASSAADTVLRITGITPEEGIEAFNRLLSLDKIPQVVVSTGNLGQRLRQWVSAPTGAETNRSLHKRPDLQTGFEAPRSEAEKIVVEIWQELLGMDMLGVNDNFFELGGHSLVATKLISRLREIFRIDISLSTLFNRPTIREIVDNIVQTWGDNETVEEIARTYREVQ